MPAVLAGVMFGRLFGVMSRVQMMSVRDVRVMCGLFMLADLVMLGGFAMMARGMFVMLSRFVMVFCPFVCCHRDPLSLISPGAEGGSFQSRARVTSLS